MGILSFFNRKKPIEKVKERQGIPFEKLSNYISNEQEEIEKNKSEFFESIHEIIFEHSERVEKKVKILVAIDIDSKKIEERAKIIVKQSVEKYVIEVKKLLAELKNSEKNSIEEFINQVNYTFTHFNKRSAIFYGRSNYIIGDELLAVKNAIQKIHQEFDELLDSKKEIIKKSITLREIASSLEIISEKTNKKDEYLKEITKIDTLIQEKEKIIAKIETDIEQTKKSKEYSFFKKSLEEIDTKEQAINKMILECKSLINFKELMGLYYSSESKREVIKKYKDSFSIQFRESEIQDLLGLIIDSKISNRDKILALVAKIAKQKEEKKEDKARLGKDIIAEKNSIKKRHLEELKKLQEDKALEKKIEESFNKEIEKIKIAIQEKLEMLNINII